MTFAEKLNCGQVGESLIANWLRDRGWSVLPVYEKEIDSGKGPRLFTPGENLIAPDMMAFRIGREDAYWVEAKHKTAFSLYRKTGCWTTGIDLVHYRHYCELDDTYTLPVWLLFLHLGGQAKDSPADSPSGLFGREIAKLRKCESHRSDRWGSGGMVYWARESLIQLANLCEFGV